MGRRHYRGVADSLIFGNSAASPPTHQAPIGRPILTDVSLAAQRRPPRLSKFVTCRSADKRWQFPCHAGSLRRLLWRALLAVLSALGVEHFLRAACQYQFFSSSRVHDGGNARDPCRLANPPTPITDLPRGCRRSPQFFVPDSNSAAKARRPAKIRDAPFAQVFCSIFASGRLTKTLRICNLCIEYERLSLAQRASTASNCSRTLDERCVRLCRKLQRNAPRVRASEVKVIALLINCRECSAAIFLPSERCSLD